MLGGGGVAGVELVPGEGAWLVDRPAPAKVPGCQMPKTAPVGSAKTAIVPRSMTSIGSAITLPPASATAAAVASASATET